MPATRASEFTRQSLVPRWRVAGKTGSHQRGRPPVAMAQLLESAAVFKPAAAAMIELNPVRQRIADLTGRVVSLRGYL